MAANNIVEFCVTGIEVKRDQRIVFMVSWKKLSGSGALIKRSAVGMDSIYIIDNLGNKYQPIGVSGEAAQDIVLGDKDAIVHWYGKPVTLRKVSRGAFTFSPIKPGATSFLFHGTGANGIIDDIVLENWSMIYDTLMLKDFPFRLDYRIELWEPLETENGNPAITHKEILNCTMRQTLAMETQGKYKNTVKLGQIEYEIYGWWEQNWAVREYVPISGLDELSDDQHPIILVTIPYGEDEIYCLNYSGEVLATLFFDE